MEAAGYAFGAVDTCAAGFGAPHIRQRLYWMAVAHEGKRGRFANGAGSERDRPAPGRIEGDGFIKSCRQSSSPGRTKGLWSGADWVDCQDGRRRPVEAGTFPLVDARTIRNRVGKLRGSGNSLNLAQAQAFIEAAIAII
jgi:DNA (cytosine-5)-methyltransferase 1